jgi:hypothetical protein
MNRSCADAKFLRYSQNPRPGRQLRPDALNDIGAHGATPEPPSRCSGSREARIDAASAVTRLSTINLILRGSVGGKPLTKDQRDSIDLENRKGR